MGANFTQAAHDMAGGIALIGASAPEAMRAFCALSIAATAPSALDQKTRELMALAIGIAVRCDGCVAFHTRTAIKRGASRQEIAETGALAVYMGGGPAAVYGADARRAFDEFAAAP